MVQSNRNSADGGWVHDKLYALAHLASITAEECSVEGVRVSPALDPDTSILTNSDISLKRGLAKKRAASAKSRTLKHQLDVSHCKKLCTFSPSLTGSPQKYKCPSKRFHRSGPKVFELKAGQPSFPVLLMAIMSSSMNEKYISFLSDGQSFIIIDPDGLRMFVLCNHFEHDVPTNGQFSQLLKSW